MSRKKYLKRKKKRNYLWVMQLHALLWPISRSATWVWSQQKHLSHAFLGWCPVLLHAQHENLGSNWQITLITHKYRWRQEGCALLWVSTCQRIEPKVPQTGHVIEQPCDFTTGFSQCQNTLPLKETVQPKIAFPSLLVWLFCSHTSGICSTTQLPKYQGQTERGIYSKEVYNAAYMLS